MPIRQREGYIKELGKKYVLSSVVVLPMMPLSRRLLSEPYLDADLHGVLLHLLSQIPDHMPCSDSLLVLLPSAKNIW